MPTGSGAPFQYLWLHEDGNFYSCFKLPYEGNSQLHLVYDNGFHIPAEMVFE